MFHASAKPILALKTKKAIDDALEKDQGNLFRKYLQEEIVLASDAYRQNDPEAFRSHLGASLIGRDCARALWYSFRWAVTVKHVGRMIRLFNRGHLEEARFIALFKMIGCQVWSKDEAGRQFRIHDHMGHFGGSLDAVAKGIPDDLEEPFLLEFKTHNDKSFGKIVGQGCRSAKPEHYAQMQTYMKGYGLRKGLYGAVNKNDDDLHLEIILADKEAADMYSNRAREIITSVKPPPKINESPSWFVCKFCDFKNVCHNNALPATNCRTCMYSQPVEEGQWKCTRHNSTLTEEAQLAGCPDYRWSPNF